MNPCFVYQFKEWIGSVLTLLVQILWVFLFPHFSPVNDVNTSTARTHEKWGSMAITKQHLTSSTYRQSDWWKCARICYFVQPFRLIHIKRFTFVSYLIIKQNLKTIFSAQIKINHSCEDNFKGRILLIHVHWICYRCIRKVDMLK